MCGLLSLSLCLTTARGGAVQQGGETVAKRNIENENKENYELCQARTTGGQGRAEQSRAGAVRPSFIC